MQLLQSLTAAPLRRRRLFGCVVTALACRLTKVGYAQESSEDMSAATAWIADVPPGPANTASSATPRNATASNATARNATARNATAESVPGNDASPTWYAPAIRQQRLHVDSFDDQRLSARRSGDDEPVTIRADQIVWLETKNLSDAERIGLDQIAIGKPGQAMRSLLKSLESRPPIWRQQFLSMAVAQCAARTGRGAIAVELVRQLDARPLPPLVLGWLPIEWQTGVVPAASKKDRAIEANGAESPMTRLVLASWMIEKNRDAANTVLRQLAVQDDRPLVASLAKLVPFRTATPPEVKSQWRSVLRQIESLPLTLQTGPLVMLAGKLTAAGEDEEAEKLIGSLQIVPICPHPDVPESLGIWIQN